MTAHGDLMMYQGDDYSTAVRVRDANGSDADISACTALAQIRRGYADDDNDVVAAFTCTIDSPRVLLLLGKEETTRLRGRYYWDLQLTDANDVVTTVIAGVISVQAEVTR